MRRHEWCQITIRLPPESISPNDSFHQVWNHLKSMGFIENDWCHLERPDGAIVELAPCPPPDEREYIDIRT